MKSLPAKGPFGLAAEKYRESGLLGPLPLPPGEKNPPPKGFTGSGKPDPTDAQVAAWVRGKGRDLLPFDYNPRLGNIALRLAEVPPEFVGERDDLPFAYAGNNVDGWEVMALDVDDYGDKHGGDDLAELEGDHGPLPATAISSARWDTRPRSGTRLFLVPKGYRFMGKAASSIDVVQKRHRFTVVAPSTNPDAGGAEYEWRHGSSDGVEPMVGYPHVGDPEKVAVLPEPWFVYLSRGGTVESDHEISDLTDDELFEWAKTLRYDDEPCDVMRRTLDECIANLESSSSSHDKIVPAHWRLFNLAAEGHAGLGRALDEFHPAWGAHVAGNRGDIEAASAEMHRSALGALDKIQPLYAGLGRPSDKCAVDPSAFDSEGWAERLSAQEADADDVEGETLWPSPDAPRDVAMRVIEEAKSLSRPWCYWNGMWFVWDGTHYEQTAPEALRDWLYELLAEAKYAGKDKPLRWKPNSRKLNEVIDAARGLARLPEGTKASQWLDGHEELVIPCKNGLLRVGDRALLDHTPDHFNIMSLPYSYDANAVCPRWERFLKEVFEGDTESVDLLQQWFGYVLSGRTDLHKMVMWLGPTRCGKGTVARLLKRLVGPDAYAGTAVENLRSDFALEGLLGKSLVTFPDEKEVAAPEGKRLVQFILKATGEDDQEVKRKYKTPWHGPLPMRVMYLGNDLPVLPDSSGAVQNRILMIETAVSFLGREDRELESELAGELPGILNWALDGLDALHRRGEFVQPESGRAAARDVDDLSNHVRRYLVSGQVELDSELKTECSELWHDFDAWCHRSGVEVKVNSVWLGRQLRPAMRNLAPEAKFDRKQDNTVPGRPYYYHGIGLVETPKRSGAQPKWV